MGMDLDCAATFGSILTILGDTYALLCELSEKNKENEDKDEDKDKSECNCNDNPRKKEKDDKEKDSDDNNDDDSDSGDNGVFLGTFISFIGDLIEAVVGVMQAHEKYGTDIPQYIERGIIGSWLIVIGDILQLQSLIAEANKN